MLLEESLKQHVYNIDATIDNYTLGRLIVDGDKAIVQTDDRIITLNKTFKIEIIKNYEYVPITYNQVFTLSTDGWPLLAGCQVRIKRSG